MIAAGFSLPKYGAGGSYGDETVQAVKALQKRSGYRGGWNLRTGYRKGARSY
ncbi:hypothetical protein [Bacillus haynesii]|uniref:hypothetical protein n=1 Tax=Bacillus haynesii TaxID=1925021 RepID=UPI002280CB20|nr:hypothetical protein [Bacillus haynesii]MCY8225222.1 hypothetical protein [Bacillus haynesii]